jgi:hypothetical protein
MTTRTPSLRFSRWMIDRCAAPISSVAGPLNALDARAVDGSLLADRADAMSDMERPA